MTRDMGQTSGKDAEIFIGNHRIADDSPCFIIAELSANHDQKLDIAVKSVHAAKEAGADAIKLQTYTPDTMTIACDNEYFKIKQGTIWDGQNFHKLYQTAYTPWEWHAELQRVAHECGLAFFSTPFDPTAVEFLDKLDVPAYKIASFEITDIPLIELVASKGKPVIMSNGIASLEDIDEAVAACRRMGNEKIILLKCTSSYPAPLEEVNLRTIPDMRKRFGVQVGLSDHTLGSTIPVSAVALGARVVEKHFIIDKKIGGPDASFSLEPHEFKAMVQAVRDTERAIGRVSYELTDKTRKNRELARSLFVVKDVKAGETFTSEHVRSIRPGFGLHPRHLKEIIGKRAASDVARGTPLTWDHVKR